MSLNPSTILEKDKEKEKEITETLKEEIIEPVVKEEEVEEDEEEDQTLVLELGDVIKITNSDDEELNDNTFIIDYIDKSKMKLIDINNMNKIRVIKIGENGELGNGSITGLTLLSRREVPGFARQNGLLTGKWLNIYFGGEVPFILTGQITNLEEDMIELKIYPDCDVIYINFDYKGIPEDLQIENIEIRDKPEDEPKCVEGEFIKEGEGEGEGEAKAEGEGEVVTIPDVKEEIAQPDYESDELLLPTVEIKSQLRKIILDASDLVFTDEKLGVVRERKKEEPNKQMYSIETQANDLLDELLSTIPYIDRTNIVLNDIHLMIERFKQLRKEYSMFDHNQNVVGFFFRGADWKPLISNLKEFEKMLYWILPVAKNVKKTCTDPLFPHSQQSTIVDVEGSIQKIKEIVQRYKTNSTPSDENKYATMIKDLQPYLTPFEEPHPQSLNTILYENDVKTTMKVILDNSENFYSKTALFLPEVRFLSFNYVTGYTQLINVAGVGTKGYTKVEPLTNSDVIYLKSFLTLPEPVVRFSRINLPGTTLLEKTQLSRSFIRYWEFLKDNTDVQEVAINNFDEKIDYDTFDFIGNIKNYVLELIVEDDAKEMTKNEIYLKYLDKVVPKTRILFDIVKKYITGKLSLVEIINTLEPFMVYSNDITYLLYTEMASFLDEKVHEYNKIFLEKKRMFGDLKNSKQLLKNYESLNYNIGYIKAIQNIFGANVTQEKNIFENYKIDNNPKNIVDPVISVDYKKQAPIVYTNSELLRKLILRDFGNLYNSAVVMENLKYMFSDKITDVFELDKDKLKQQIKEYQNDNTCSTYKIVKKYRTLDELKTDNNKTIYCDVEYDDTRYSLIDKYEKEMLSMSPDDFLKFLIDKLKKDEKMNETEAIKMAEILIEGHKKVEEGNYAVLFHPDGEKYFKRENNIWVLDETVNEKTFKDTYKFELKELFITDQSNMCNVQDKCIDVNSNCETLSLNKAEIMDNNYKKILNEFDKKYNLSSEDLRKQIAKKYVNNLLIISQLEKIEIENMTKYNNEKFKIGFIQDEKIEDIPISPYTNLKNLVLGETDFVSKQAYIIRFAKQCTREAVSGFIEGGKQESPYWLYCNKTAVPLLPKSIYQIATYFVSDYDNFMVNVDNLVNKIGASSDDGEAWVDKHCGNVLLRKDFDVEEGYEEGFKVKTRAILEEDIGELLLGESKIEEKVESVELKVVNNIIMAISSSMGINLDEQAQFIKRNVSTILSTNLPQESAYKKEILEASKRNINLPSYKDLYNATIMYTTLGMILISIQTSIPSIKTKKTYPGCPKSFMGYPIEGAGDDSAVKYLACIAYKIRNSTDPWSSLLRKKEDFIANKIKDSIDKNLWVLPEVIRKVEEKAKHMIETKDFDIPEEYDLQKWKQFLPPLVDFKIKNLNNITPQFKSKLMSSMRTGSSSQREDLLVIESKITQFSLDIQEKIRNVVNSKALLMKTSNNIFFTENACCLEQNKQSTIGYFMKENPDIKTENTIVTELANILDDVNVLSKAIYLLSNINTKMKYSTLSNSTFDEETIYRAFIVYCRFTSLIPLTEELLAVCNEKPDINLRGLSIEEQITKLKRDNREYTNDSLLRLLQIINRQNIVHVSIDTPQFTTIQRLRDVVETFKNMEEKVVSPELCKLIEPTLDTFDVAITDDTDDMKHLKNFLSKSNAALKSNIVKFVKKNLDADITEMLNKLFIWNDNGERDIDKISDETTYNMLNFMKTYIENISAIFPISILNKVNHNTNLQSYWNLSENHRVELVEKIKKYYLPLEKYYDNNFVVIVLNKIQEKTKNLLLLVNETPYFSPINYKGKETYSIFDKRTSKLLIEQYFFLVLNEYINICENEPVIFEASSKTTNVLDDVYTVEGLDLVATRKTVAKTTIREEIDFTENRFELKKNTAELFVSYLQIILSHKKTIDVTYDEIMDSVFKTKENEKLIMIERLEGLKEQSQELLDVDNMFKSLGLGPVWGKGQEKGHRKYNKRTRDEDREFVNKLHKLENKLRDEGADDTAVNIAMEEATEEMQMENEIDAEVYDISDMHEDYMDGQYNPDDIGNGADVDYNEYY